jgi:hypothetical protein
MDFRALTIQSGVLTQLQNANSLIVGSGISTAAGNLTINPAGGDVVLSAGSNLVAASGDGYLDFSAASGEFKTSTGAVSLNGDTTLAADKDLAAATGTGTFSWASSSGSFDTSTGAVGLKGDTTLAADKDFTAATGDGAFSFGNATGTFSTSTGVNTLNGDVTVAAGKDLSAATGDGTFSWAGSTGSFDTSTGAVGLKGDTTLAAGKDLTAATGDGNFDFSGSTGTFSTSTGAVTVGGAATFTAAGTALTVNYDAKVSGTLYANTVLPATGTAMTIGSTGTTVTLPGNLVVQGTETVIGQSTFESPVNFENNVTQSDGYTAHFSDLYADDHFHVTGDLTQSGGAFSLEGPTGSIKTTSGALTLDGYSALNLLVNGSPVLDFTSTSITIPAGVTLGTTGTANINLPNNASARFQIEGVPVDGYVTAAHLIELTNGSTTTLHAHPASSVAWGVETGFTTSGLASGDCVYMSANMTATKTDSAALASSYFAGVYDGTSGELKVNGVFAMSVVAGLTVGQPVYLASGANAGKVTSVAPGPEGPGVVAPVGICVDASTNKVLIQVYPPVVL